MSGLWAYFELDLDIQQHCQVRFWTVHPAYVAGFLDADGCFSLIRGQRLDYRIVVAQVKPDAVLAIKREFGGTLTPIRPRRSQERRLLRLTICGEERNRLVAKILPHLRIKHRQAELLNSAFEDNLTLPNDAHPELSSLLAQEKSRRIDPRTFTSHKSHQTFRFKPKQTYPCSVCGNPAHARFLCRSHFKKAYDQGILPNVSQPHRERAVEEFNYQRTPTLDELAYLAGVFDGDGNICVDRNKVILRVAQVEPVAVYLFHEIYGGGVSLQLRAGKPVALWAAGKQAQVEQVLADMAPHLLEKQAEAQLVSQDWRRGDPNQVASTLKSWRKKGITQEELNAWIAEGLLYPEKQTCIAEHNGIVCGVSRIAGNKLCPKHWERWRKTGDPCKVGSKHGTFKSRL